MTFRTFGPKLKAQQIKHIETPWKSRNGSATSSIGGAGPHEPNYRWRSSPGSSGPTTAAAGNAPSADSPR